MAPTGIPNITSFAPASPVSNTAGSTRTFNITVNQGVNVTWYINGTIVFNQTNVTESSYTNTSAVIGTWNVTAIANNTNGEVSQEWIWNVIEAPTPAPPPAPGTATGGGGGGGGGVISPEPPTNIETYEIADEYLGANVPASYIFTTPDLVISEVLITPAKNFGITSIRVEMLRDLSKIEGMTPPPGILYKYANIWVGARELDNPGSIIDAFIGFKVERSWIAQNNLEENSMRLLRWDGNKWTSLDTQPTSRDETFVYYYSKTSGFSPFAIVAAPSATGQGVETPNNAPVQKLMKQLALERISKVWVYVLIALMLISIAIYKLSKYQKKAIKTHEIMEVEPEDADALYDKGFALYESGKYEEAAKAYDRAREKIHESKDSD